MEILCARCSGTVHTYSWIRPPYEFAVLPWLVLGAMAHASLAQQLPPGGEQIPQLRRGGDGQIEAVRPNIVAPAEGIRHGSAPAAGQRAHPSRANRVRSRAVASPPRPVITVTPSTPQIPATAPRGTVVAHYSVTMSDGSPFAGTVRFGAPYFDANGVFALSGNSIIVNPNGLGLGPNKATITTNITLEATTGQPHLIQKRRVRGS